MGSGSQFDINTNPAHQQALAPYITQAVGIDISPNMVHEYNT
jgi:hypothetical protein